jgi:DNA-binding winged helix-turn-helix (wHTH) protein/tetratricopeptide (TPR) repeat protein
MGTQPSAVRFGAFEWNREAVELRRAGVRIRIQKQPLQLLAVLLERPGQAVTRQELQNRLWPSDTFVDFEDGLNTAIKKLREALGDEKEHPQFIETIPRHGYRFIAQIETVDAANPNGDHAAAGDTAAQDTSAPRISSNTRSRQKLWIALGLVPVIAGGLALWLTQSRPAFSFATRDSVLVADFENHTGDPRFDEALQTAFLISLRQSQRANIFPEARLDSVLKRMGKSANEKITPAVGREICQRENIRGLVVCSITRTGQEYAVTAELIDPQTGEIASSHSERSYGEDHILDALDALAGDIRRDLGESLYQIHRAGAPLPQVTTRSLTALKQFADGQSLWHRGKFDEAMTLFRAAVETDPEFAMAHAALANGYYSYIYYKPDQGKQEYEKALSLTSRTTDRERLLIQTNLEVDQEQVDAAMVLYKTYLTKYPDDWKVRLDYARILRRHNRKQQAVEQYEQVLLLAPDDAKAYIERATAYKGLGQFQKALDDYAQAFRLEPGWLTSGNVNREYGFMLVVMGQDDGAIQAFTAMLANPETRAQGLRSMGMLDLYHGRFAAGRQRLEQALRIQEAKADVFDAAREHFMLAVIAKEGGDSQGQMEQLEASVAHLKEIGPKVTWAALVGQEYARIGAVAKAEKLAETVAASVDRRNVEDNVYFHVLQAEVALAKGDVDTAIKGLSALESETSSDSRTILTEALAHAYQKSGKTDQAIAWYEKLMAVPGGGAASWEPQQHWLAAYSTLASDYASRGEKQKARETLAIFLNLWKDADSNLPLLKQAKAEYANLQ